MIFSNDPKWFPKQFQGFHVVFIKCSSFSVSPEIFPQKSKARGKSHERSGAKASQLSCRPVASVALSFLIFLDGLGLFLELLHHGIMVVVC